MLRVGLCSKTPRGRTGRARSVKRGGAHLQYIYNRLQKVSGRSVENSRTSSLHKPVRTTDGRMDGRTYTHPNSDLSPIPKLVLLPIDAISVEKNKRTDRVKPIWPSDYRQGAIKSRSRLRRSHTLTISYNFESLIIVMVGNKVPD